MELTRKDFLKAVAGAAITGGAMSSPLLLAQGKSDASSRQRQIADVQLFPVFLKSKVVVRIALGVVPVGELVLVRLRTNDGVVGWGEASPYSRVTGETPETDIAMGKKLAEIVRGQDPFHIGKLVAEMAAYTTDGQPSIRAALEMAIWDVCGKIANQPVYHLLGQYRDSFETDATVDLDTQEEMVRWAASLVAGGFKTLKVKLGEAPETDIERIRAIRTAVGKDIRIRVDANQGWTPEESVRALRGLEQYTIQFCEQPVVYNDWEGLKFVREHAPIPVMADEAVHTPADAIEAVRREAVELINIKLMKAGGILPSVRIAQIADAANIKCMVGCMAETKIGLTAAAQVVVSQKNVLYADLDGYLSYEVDPVLGGMQVKDGIVTLPDSPGLGLDVDPAWFKTLKPA